MHTLEIHGGETPQMLALLDKVEPRPMYRIIREAVMIEQMEDSMYNMNRCQEMTGLWGAQPKLTRVVMQGGRQSPELLAPENPNPMWTAEVKRKIHQGKPRGSSWRPATRDQDWIYHKIRIIQSPRRSLQQSPVLARPPGDEQDPATNDQRPAQPGVVGKSRSS